MTESDAIVTIFSRERGYSKRVTFENGYTLSIQSHLYSYGGKDGLFECAVYYGGEIVYDTPITSDVLAYCTFADVAKAIADVAALPAKNT